MAWQAVPQWVHGNHREVSWAMAQFGVPLGYDASAYYDGVAMQDPRNETSTVYFKYKEPPTPAASRCQWHAPPEEEIHPIELGIRKNIDRNNS